MKQKKSAMLLTVLLSISIVLGSINLHAPSAAVSTLKPQTYPQTYFSPPSNQTGNGYNMNLTESVNGWHVNSTLKANNTFNSYQYRNAPAFSEPTPSGYTKVWQRITVFALTASPDVREVQYASDYDGYLRGRSSGGGTWYDQLAMRFYVVDKLNLTGIWMYYGTSEAVPLNIVNSSVNAELTPNGRPTIATYTLPVAATGWNEVKFNSPLTLHAGFYYWIVVNATNMGGGKEAQWYYTSDPGGGISADDKRAAAFYTTWRDESLLTPTYPYLNFLLMLDVLPVSTTDVSKVRTYNSPLQVAMNETNSNIQLLSNTTRIPVAYSTFVLRANTSVTFTVNCTARFEYSQPNAVSTHYTAENGLTLWNASFSTTAKPTDPYTWYNLTFKVTTVPLPWSQTSPPTNVTNTWGYPSSFSSGGGYYLINQTDLSSWLSNSWLINAKSTYSIIASAPSQIIQGQAFNVTVSATVLPSTRTILVLDRSDNVLYNRTFFVSSSPYYHQLRLNATGDNNVILVDRGVSQNEVSFFNASWVIVLRALTQMSLESQTVNATWGDQIHVRVNYENATNGVELFPSSPLPFFNIGGYAVPLVTNEGGGWYSFNYPSSLQPAAGSYLLSVSANYIGTYANVTTLNLNLAKINMTLSIVMDQTSVSVDSSLTVSAQLTFRNGTKVPNGFNVRFDFFVTWENGTQSTYTKYEAISNGTATASLLAVSGMKSITVTVTYEGTSILHEVADTRQNIPVTASQGLPIPLLIGIGVGGALVVIIPLAIIVKRRKSRETETRKTSVLRQTASLAQLIVVDLRSGRSVFSRSIGSEESVDPNLISGFLSANQSIIGEVFKKQTGAGLRFADYGEYKVISNIGNHIMATLFATETAGAELKDVLQKFTEKFEKKYGKSLESWDGEMSTFKDADEIADEVFCLPLTAPHMLLEVPTAQLNKVERAAVQSARILSGERGVFFMPQVIDFLLTKQGLKRGKAMDVINSLTNKGVFRQLTIEQAAQVVKSCAEKPRTQS